MAKCIVVDADQLEYDSFINLHFEAFNEIGTETLLYSSKFFHWKFHPPVGIGQIALIYEKNKLVSTNTMIPFELCVNGRKIIGWQATDAATAKNSRRKGYSSSCLKALLGLIKRDEVLFLFPNQNAKHFVSEIGAYSKGTIHTWLKIPLTRQNNSPPEISTISRFGLEQDRFAEALRMHSSSVQVFCSANYLNWCYVNNPIYKYVIFSFDSDEGRKGFAIIRSRELLGKKIISIEELWGMEDQIIKKLIRFIQWWSIRRNVHWILIQDNGHLTTAGLRYGFLPIPTRMLPTRNAVMAFLTPGNISNTLRETNWQVLTGNWDHI